MTREKEYKQFAKWEKRKGHDLNTFISKDAAVRAVLKVPAGNWKSARYADEIAVLPAADVAPVIRCKDCKFWNRERISVEGLARCQTGETGIRYRKATDFCSRGAKMDLEET